MEAFIPKVGHWEMHDWASGVDNTTPLRTVNDRWGTLWTLSIGVVIGVSWKWAKPIVARLLAWLCHGSQQLWRKISPEPGPDDEQASLLQGVSDRHYGSTSPNPMSLVRNNTPPQPTEHSPPPNSASHTKPTSSAEPASSADRASSPSPMSSVDLASPPNSASLAEPMSTTESEPVSPPSPESSPKPSSPSSPEPSPKPTEDSIPWLVKMSGPDLIILVSLGLSTIAYAYAGGMAGKMPINSSGLAKSSDCGFWELKYDADQKIRDNDNLIQAQKEMRASQYAKNCYGDRPMDHADQCKIFETIEIPHTMEEVNCPFNCPDPDHCICANGIYNSAVKFDTGPFRIDKLGINAAHLPLIRRTSTFVPLDIDYGFVVDKSGPGDYDYKYEYYLGPINTTTGSRNFTYSMAGVPFFWDITTYAVSAYESTPLGGEHDAWHPSSDLLPRRKHTYMTVIFVSSCRIFYNGRCEDPVFPATTSLKEPFPLFINGDPRPRVLIAIDEMQVCASDGDNCDSSEELPTGISQELRSAYELARSVFKRTSTYQLLRYRRGSSLMAADGISGYESRKLDDKHWIIESHALFNSSLARLQFNARDFAIGDRPKGDSAGGYENAYNNTTPDWARHKNCPEYRTPLSSLSGEYVNIHETHALFFLIPILLFIGSFENKYVKGAFPLDGSWMIFDSIPYLIVTYMLGWFAGLLTWLGEMGLKMENLRRSNF